MERIRILREALGLNQEEFAKALFISQATVSRWESDSVLNISKSSVKKISAVFHVSTLWIETGAGDIFEGPADGSISPPMKDFFYKIGFGEISSLCLELLCHMNCEKKQAIEEFLKSKGPQYILEIFKTVCISKSIIDSGIEQETYLTMVQEISKRYNGGNE